MGEGTWARVPWISIFDVRETTTIRNGVYCVYLFRQDMSGVYLTFNQGVTMLGQEVGAKRARLVLRERAQKLGEHSQDLLGNDFVLDDQIDLRADTGLVAQYENSTIAYRLYEAG